jgi:hypothetical protein
MAAKVIIRLRLAMLVAEVVALVQQDQMAEETATPVSAAAAETAFPIRLPALQ